MAVETKPWQILLGGGGAATVLVALLLNINQNASIAIDVSAQHGLELNTIRAELTVLRDYVNERTHSRYTRQDSERDMDYIQKELSDIEDSIKRLQVRHEK